MRGAGCGRRRGIVTMLGECFDDTGGVVGYGLLGSFLEEVRGSVVNFVRVFGVRWCCGEEAVAMKLLSVSELQAAKPTCRLAPWRGEC